MQHQTILTLSLAELPIGCGRFRHRATGFDNGGNGFQGCCDCCWTRLYLRREPTWLVRAIETHYVWSPTNCCRSLINHQKEIRVLVDLDAEKGIEPRIGKDGTPRENKVRVRITQAKPIVMEILKEYLVGKTSFSEHVLECISESSDLFQIA